jgi:hypothetical protein
VLNPDHPKSTQGLEIAHNKVFIHLSKIYHMNTTLPNDNGLASRAGRKTEGAEYLTRKGFRSLAKISSVPMEILANIDLTFNYIRQ